MKLMIAIYYAMKNYLSKKENFALSGGQAVACSYSPSMAAGQIPIRKVGRKTKN